MKSLIVSILCLSLIGCGATSNPPSAMNPTTPGPNVGVIVAATALVASCEVADISTSSPNAQAWLQAECAPTAASILAIVEASGAAAKIQAAITALQLSYTSALAGTFTPRDQQIIGASIAAAVSVYQIYDALTSTITTSAVTNNGLLRLGNADDEIVIGGHVFRASDVTVMYATSFQGPSRPAPRKLNLTPAERKQLEALRKRAEQMRKKGKK